MQSSSFRFAISDRSRALVGFVFGLAIMIVAVRIFIVNSYDFDNMQRGISMLLAGKNPWVAETHIRDFYNPPFSVIFLWPMVFTTPRVYLAIGGALLFGFAFYRRAWVALSWFATNIILWLISAGGIDMFVIGGGLLLLIAGDNKNGGWVSLMERVLAYGLLMVKPQGTVFIVALFILTRRDWKGLLISVFLYGILFSPFYPAWVEALIHEPPPIQILAAHTIWSVFGPWMAGMIALLVLLARRWKYWQIGGALAGILTPYGMPGLPVFLTLTGVKSLKTIPIIVIWSGCMAFLTWVNPPQGVDFGAFINPYMTIYHIGMMGLALILACLSPENDESDTIAVGDWIKSSWQRFSLRTRPN